MKKRKTNYIFVATDGHKIGRVEAILEDSELNAYGNGESSRIIPEEFFIFLMSLPKKEDFAMDLIFDDTKILLKSPTLTREFELIDGQFPDYQRCMPNPESFTQRLSFNAHYLKELAESIIKTSPNKKGSVYFNMDYADNTSPCRITTTDETLYYALMPMRR